jgi:hypothetical protein
VQAQAEACGYKKLPVWGQLGIRHHQESVALKSIAPDPLLTRACLHGV